MICVVGLYSQFLIYLLLERWWIPFAVGYLGAWDCLFFFLGMFRPFLRCLSHLIWCLRLNVVSLRFGIRLCDLFENLLTMLLFLGKTIKI